MGADIHKYLWLIIPQLRRTKIILQKKMKELKCEEQKESHHETEEPHGLGQGEPENSVGEQLLLEGGIPGISYDERPKNRSNTSSRSSNPNSSSSCTNKLGSRVNVSASWRGLQSPHSSYGRLG